MTIQAVTKICLVKKSYFGRPISWRGSGEALDLGRRLDSTQVRKVITLRSPDHLLGEEWKINPQDFLGKWEAVTAQKLAQEFNKHDQENRN